MKETMKHDARSGERGKYEAPQMTVVPLRASASLLTGSAVGMMSGSAHVPADELWDFQSSSSDNIASSWNTATDDGFGEGWDNFFGE